MTYNFQTFFLPQYIKLCKVFISILFNLNAQYSYNIKECQAYTNLIDAYRASGPLTDDKKSSLESVARILNISSERHKAEARRAEEERQAAEERR